MFVVAVTGGIGSGKSTVAELFRKKGIPFIDTDIVARELAHPGSPLLQAIAEQFGTQFVTSDGSLDRKALREYVFNYEPARLKLESLMHPAIQAEVNAQLEKLAAAYCLILIPLLATNPAHYPHDRVLFIDAPEPLRIKRSAARDHQSTDKIRQIMASQPSRSQMLAIADDVLDNGGDLTQLAAGVTTLHHKYLELAKAKQA